MNNPNNQIDLDALFSLSYGLYVVSSFSVNGLNGQISNTVFQVTAEPPRIAVSINKGALTHEYISGSGLFSVSVLDKSTPMTFIGLFGFKSGREVDKFSDIAFYRGPTGCPVVTEHTLTVLLAKVINLVDVETHTIFIADIIGAEVLKEGKPLTYAFYREIRKGKASQKAPTYRAPIPTLKPDRRAGDMKKYVCDICGYVYDPAAGDPENEIQPGTAFEDLPDDWACPVCGATKSDFSPE